MQNILLIGGNGNLGSEIQKHLSIKDYKIFLTSKNPDSSEQIYFDGSKPLILPKNINIDLIINAANKYYVNSNFEETRSMKNAIIGVADNILLSNLYCPIIFFSSYLQYLPNEFQPWSDYTIMKSEASEILREYGRNRNVTTLELTLYDNYGGKRKNKFFDLALDSVKSKKKFKATGGDSVINLTHVSDIVENLSNFIVNDSEIFMKKTNFSFSIRTNETFTLRNLVKYIETVSGKQVLIEWGSIPYRNKEVLQHYNTKPIVPGFLQNRTLHSYISSYLL